MRIQLLVSSLLFGSSALAAQLNERFIGDPMSLERRQQFKPTTTTAEGSTCADAFGAGYVTCMSLRALRTIYPTWAYATLIEC